MDEINQCYIKMLFVQAIRGQFMPNDDGIFSRLLTHFHDESNLLAHSAFDKFLKIMHLQGSLVQTENTRMQMEHALNVFINIAKNQDYDRHPMRLEQLVEIYLGFEETNSTGEILLSEITYLAKTSNFTMSTENFPLYRQLLFSVLNNIEKKLKYERRDYLNKEYTRDTVNFLRDFLPQYIQLWPAVIFELNHAQQELFLKD
jgi:hypothetical protein